MTWIEIQHEDIDQILAQLNRQMRDIDIATQRRLPRGGFEFYQVNIAANQTDVQLNTVGGTQIGYLALRAGFIISFGVFLSTARTAGTATFVPTINGTPVSTTDVPEATIEINGTDTTTLVKDLPSHVSASFSSGDRLGIEVTTPSSWTPVTADVIASMLVRYDAED